MSSRAVTLISVAVAFGVLAYAGSSQTKQLPLQVSVTNSTSNPVPVTVQGSPTVKVSNGSAPLAVQVVENKTFTHFSAGALFASNSQPANVEFTVPADKRFHATFISLNASLDVGQDIIGAFVNVDGASIINSLPVTDQGKNNLSNSEWFSAAQAVDFVAEPGSVITVSAARNTTGTSGSLSVVLTGYSETVPAAP